MCYGSEGLSRLLHQATISVAILDSAAKLVMEAILETKAETILQFIRGLLGSLHVTFEEGTCAAWLHDLLKLHVAQVLVCDPRKSSNLFLARLSSPSVGNPWQLERNELC